MLFINTSIFSWLSFILSYTLYLFPLQEPLFAFCHLCPYSASSSWLSILDCVCIRPGRLPGIAENAGNHGNDGKFHKSYQILNQIKTNNKLWLGKSNVNGSKYKIFCEFRVFEYPIWRKMKTQKCRKSTESFLNKKITHCERLPLPENS